MKRVQIIVATIYFIIAQYSVLKAQNYTVLGTTSTYTGCNCYRLTQNTTNQAGAVFQNASINLNNSFDYTFNVFFGCGNGSGADGMCFVLTTNPNGLGSSGGGLGYGYSGSGTNTQINSLAIEFDTYQNTGEPSCNHIAFESGGSINHNVAGPVCATSTNAPIDNCAYHTVRIVWDVSTHTYSVYLDGNMRLNKIINNIASSYFGGNSVVYWGWSAGTGAITNEQRICIESTSSWSVGSNYNACGLTVQFTDNSTSNVGNVQSWAWDFGDGSSSSVQNPSHTYSAAGTYTASLTITDISSCTNTYSHTVIVDDSIKFSPTLILPLCNGNTNGNIALNPTGGNGSITYTWNPTNTNTSTISNVGAGTYSVTATDGLCTTTAQYTLSQPTALSATSSHTDVTCHGANNGTFTLNVSGGTPPYSFMGNPVSAGTNTTQNIAPTTISGNLTDNNGCSVATTETINEPGVQSLSLSSTDNICYAGTSGTAAANFINATGNVIYNWSPGGIQPGNRFNLASGTYVITATDANACSLTGNVTINEPSKIVFTAITQDIDCNNGNTGGINLTASGGTPNYTYNWSPSYISGNNLTGLSAGTYSFTITDNNNCTVDSAIILSQPQPLALLPTFTEPLCYGDTNGTITGNAQGGTLPYHYSMINGESNTNGVFNTLAVGTYTVSVVDNHNCTAQANVTVTQPDTVDINYSPPVLQVLLSGIPLSLSTNYNNNIAFSWSPTNGLSCADCANPIINPDSTTTYILTITITPHGKDCVYKFPFLVGVNREHNFYVPNAFSPNGNSVNDYFQIFTDGKILKQLHIQIFDRWGEQVFESWDEDFKWDGTYKGDIVAPGVYVYEMKLVFMDNTVQNLNGSITVIR